MPNHIQEKAYTLRQANEPILKINHIPDILHTVSIERERWYMATTAPGLEPVAADEITAKLNGSSILETMRGKVFFTAADGFDTNTLRCADNIYQYVYIGSIGMTRNDFAAFRDELSAPAFKSVIEFLIAKYASGEDNITYISNASKVGKYSFSRFELSNQFDEVLQKVYRLRRANVTGSVNTLEFRIDAIETQFMISIKLTGPDFRFRGKERLFSKAALRPPIAHSLVWLSKPFDNEIFADPFCGSGTILCEREVYPCDQLIGNDLSKTEIDNAKSNLRGPTLLFNMDARHLCFDSSTLDSVVTNLPWDRQIQVEDSAALYSAFFLRFTKYIKKDGKFIVMTSLEQVLTQTAERCGLYCRKLLTVSLHGTICGVFILKLPF